MRFGFRDNVKLRANLFFANITLYAFCLYLKLLVVSLVSNGLHFLLGALLHAAHEFLVFY